MGRMTVVAALALCALLGGGPARGEAGPFGLTWGMSRQEAGSLPGLEILREDEGEYFSAILATRVPKPLADAYSYGLLFSRRYGLVKAQWSSHVFPDDGAGEGARARYADLKNLLEERYGISSSREVPWPKAGWDAVQFYACVADPGCGPYESTWSSGLIAVRLEIRAESPSQGRLRLTYEHERLAAALEESGQVRGNRERDSL